MDDGKAVPEYRRQCVAQSCENKQLKGEESAVRYHQFPPDPKLCEEWIKATRASCKSTSNAFVCSAHFRATDYKTDKKTHLTDTAIPSIFAWSRKLPTQRVAEAPEIEKDEKEETVNDDEKTLVQRKRDHSPSKDELKTKVEEQKKKIKNLQQQLRREKKKAKTLAEVIDDIKSKGLLQPDISDVLKETFSGLSCENNCKSFQE